MHAEIAERRLHPRIIDTDWLALRDMGPAVEAVADRAVVPGAVVVDFGCGTQPYRSIFESRGAVYRAADITGGDISIDAKGHVDAGDASASLVVSFQVLEHVRDLDVYFAEVRRILRDDGYLILSTHGTWFYHPHPEDHRRWTRQGLLAELEVHGFETQDCIPILGPLAYTTVLRLTIAYHVCKKIPLVGGFFANLLAFVMNVRGYVEELITPAEVTKDNACVYVTLSRRAKISR